MPIKKKCRQYSLDYLSFGFVESRPDKRLPLCLICNKSFSNEAMKPSRLIEHLNSKHPDKKDKSLEYFKDLRDKLNNQFTIPKLLKIANNKAEDGLIASYRIAEIIAKTGKPHNIGEKLIIPVLKEVICTMMHQDATEILKSLPLSDTSVQRRIDEMASDVEQQLLVKLRYKKLSLQLDESTLPDNSSLLMAYVRYFDDNRGLQEELLFAQNLITDTKGKTTFNVLKTFFDKHNIPLKNIIACATDGAPAMVGQYQGFIAYLKTEVPGILAIHCMIHRQHLVAKHLSQKLHESLKVVITSVNRIKSHAKNDRLFRKLCQENDEQHLKLLLHTEVRWLSKGYFLTRFANLFDSIIQFFDEQGDFPICEDLKRVKKDSFYLAGLYRKLNEINLQLQGQSKTLIDCKNIISAFIDKLNLFRQNILRGELCMFPELETLKDNLHSEDLEYYGEHLKLLNKDMTTRFHDVLSMQVETWMIDPFIGSINEVHTEYQEELLELKHDEVSRAYFSLGGYVKMWERTEMSTLYPILWSKMQILMLAFPSTYLVEFGFSIVVNLVTKQRNRLNVIERGDLRLALTNIKPDIHKIASKHQAQGSH